MTIKIKNSKFTTNSIGISIPDNLAVDIDASEFINNKKAIEIKPSLSEDTSINKIINQNKEPWYKRWWMLYIVYPVLVVVVGMMIEHLFFQGKNSDKLSRLVNSQNNTHASQTAENSPGAILIQGNGNRINQVGTYAWTNKNSWFATTSATSQLGLYFVQLNFTADSPLLPEPYCLYLVTDEEVTNVIPWGNYRTTSLMSSKKELNFYSKECIYNLEKNEIISVFFNKKPKVIEATFATSTF